MKQIVSNPHTVLVVCTLVISINVYKIICHTDTSKISPFEQLLQDKAVIQPLSCPSLTPTTWYHNFKPISRAKIISENKLVLGIMTKHLEGVYLCEGINERGYTFLGIAFIFFCE